MFLRYFPVLASPALALATASGRNGESAHPLPFGTLMNLVENAANRAEPVDRGRNGNTVGSTAAVGPAFMGRCRYAN